MEVYLARQPIFHRNKDIFGYELLFRDGLFNAFPQIDGDTASSNVLSNSFFCMGIDQITGGKKAFINFTQELLLQKMPLLFPRDHLVVEILENVQSNRSLILACREIASAGYQLALDDFIYDPGLEPLIAMAGIIKIDIRLTPGDQAKEILNKLSAYPVKFLAEKVETYEEFEKYLEMGFDYFQGYFFSKPQVLKARDISPSKISLLQIMTEINRDEMQFSAVEKLISRDVSVSFKLLRYINSPYYSTGPGNILHPAGHPAPGRRGHPPLYPHHFNVLICRQQAPRTDPRIGDPRPILRTALRKHADTAQGSGTVYPGAFLTD